MSLFLTIIGFTITWLQLVKTTSAAEAAKAESERIKISLNAYDLAQEASRAIFALQTAQKHLRSGSLFDAAENYEIYRRGLLTLRAGCKKLDPATVQSIDDASKYISHICSRIEGSISKNGTNINQEKTLNIMRSHLDLIHDVSRVIEGDLI